MDAIVLRNSTSLDSERLRRMFSAVLAGWSVGEVSVWVRYSRGADFSGTCFYADRRIYINLGIHLRYPYRMLTNLARTVSNGKRWYRPVFSIGLKNPYEVVLFVFLHEVYHLLVNRARRNPRQKEGMCDRFAAKYLVERYGAIIRDPRGALVPREEWDFQDLDGFVASARTKRTRRVSAARRPRPERGPAASSKT